MHNNDIKQGTLANKSGKTAESILLPLFNAYNYYIAKYSNITKQPDLLNIDKIVFKDAPFTSIYNHNGKTEYLLINRLKNRKIRIEVKNQQQSGSVDEKLPNLFLNTIFSYPEDEIILILDGNGWKKGAIEWIKNAVNEYSNKFDVYAKSLQELSFMFSNKNLSITKKKIQVMNFSEFLAYFSTELI